MDRAASWKKKHFAKYSEDTTGGKGKSKDAPRAQRNGGKHRVKLSKAEDIAFVARVMAELREWIDSDDSAAGDAGAAGAGENGHDGGNGAAAGADGEADPGRPSETSTPAWSSRGRPPTPTAGSRGTRSGRSARAPRRGPSGRRGRAGSPGTTCCGTWASRRGGGKEDPPRRPQRVAGPAVPPDSLSQRHASRVLRGHQEAHTRLLSHLYDTKVLAEEYSDAVIRGQSSALGDLYLATCDAGGSSDDNNAAAPPGPGSRPSPTRTAGAAGRRTRPRGTPT